MTMIKDSKLFLMDSDGNIVMELGGLNSVELTSNLNPDTDQEYSLDIQGGILFGCDELCISEELDRLMEPISSNKFDVEFVGYVPRLVQRKTHKKRRINKKWLKKYGMMAVYRKVHINMPHCEIEADASNNSAKINSVHCTVR